jgi:hypothetical protein
MFTCHRLTEMLTKRGVSNPSVNAIRSLHSIMQNKVNPAITNHIRKFGLANIKKHVSSNDSDLNNPWFSPYSLEEVKHLKFEIDDSCIFPTEEMIQEIKEAIDVEIKYQSMNEIRRRAIHELRELITDFHEPSYKPDFGNSKSFNELATELNKVISKYQKRKEFSEFEFQVYKKGR